MDRNQAKELLPIIQAYAEGKVIESRCIKGDTSLWYDDEDPSFDDDFETESSQSQSTVHSRMQKSAGKKC